MDDSFKGYDSILSSATSFAAVTLSDTVDLAKRPKSVFFGAAGNVKMQGSDGNAVVFAVAANQVLPVRPTRIWATGTTVAAANIILLF